MTVRELRVCVTAEDFRVAFEGDDGDTVAVAERAARRGRPASS